MIVYDKTMLPRRIEVRSYFGAVTSRFVNCLCDRVHRVFADTRKVYCECGLRILIDPKG